MTAEKPYENDAATYCGAEYGEAREGECECPRCRVIPPERTEAHLEVERDG